MLWLNDTLEEAANSENIDGIVIVMSVPWYSTREWNATKTLYEKLAITEKITSLEFNKPRERDGRNKFLVMISGDTHMLTFDTGFHNEHGDFPIF